MSGPPLVELRDVTKVYGQGESEVRALAGANLRIDDGEFVAVMGASGSGKSTCLNVVGCLDQPTSGAYLFRGVDVGALDLDQLALLRKHYLGFVFQSYNLLARTTAVENVELPLIYRGVSASERRARAMQALVDVGLESRAKHTPAELSGGQQQRVAIARVLAGDPKFILADEPTGNLDTMMSREVMDLLEKINEAGTTIVMVTHTPECAQRAARRVHLMDGKVVDLHLVDSMPERDVPSLAAVLS